jgi:hypothetical protein
MTPREACPQCGSRVYKRNGHIHTGKQNHRCNACGRAFVLTPENSLITQEQRALIERVLLERISLRGICRAVGVGLQWLLQFIVTRLQAAPEDLYVKPAVGAPTVILQRWRPSRTSSGASWARRQTGSGCGLRWMPAPAKSLRFTWGIAARPAANAYGPTFRPRIVSRRSSTPISLPSTRGCFLPLDTAPSRNWPA